MTFHTRRYMTPINSHWCRNDVVNLYIAETSGVTYIRWGLLSCEDNGATLLYKGNDTSQLQLCDANSLDDVYICSNNYVNGRR